MKILPLKAVSVFVAFVVAGTCARAEEPDWGLSSSGAKCGAPHFVPNPEYVKIPSTFGEQALGEDLMKVYSRL